MGLLFAGLGVFVEWEAFHGFTNTHSLIGIESVFHKLRTAFISPGAGSLSCYESCAL